MVAAGEELKDALIINRPEKDVDYRKDPCRDWTIITDENQVYYFVSHPVGTSINFAFCEEIINSDIPFIMVVYEKIFGSIKK